MKELINIQAELKAPKNQFNAFGKYKYRSCEDILEAVKPLLLKYNCVLTISDKTFQFGDMAVVEAKATITNGSETIEVCSQAGIDINRKGMDIAQSFGASSSYARKYALNGLFLIDDTKDADATNTHDKEEKKEDKPQLTPKQFEAMLQSINNGKKAEVEKAMPKYQMTEQQKVVLETAIKNN